MMLGSSLFFLQTALDPFLSLLSLGMKPEKNAHLIFFLPHHLSQVTMGKYYFFQDFGCVFSFVESASFIFFHSTNNSEAPLST